MLKLCQWIQFMLPRTMPLSLIFVSSCAIQWTIYDSKQCKWLQFMCLGIVPLNSIFVEQECAIEFNLCFLGLSHWIQFMFHVILPLSSIYASWDYPIEFNLCFMWLYHWGQFIFPRIVPLSSISVSCDSAIECNLCFMTMPLSSTYASWLCHCVQFVFKDCYENFNSHIYALFFTWASLQILIFPILMHVVICISLWTILILVNLQILFKYAWCY
jgi:hypothetical protein